MPWLIFVCVSLCDGSVVTTDTNPCVVRYVGPPLVFPKDVMAQVPEILQLHEREHDEDARTRKVC